MGNSDNTILIVLLAGVALYLALKPKPAPVNPYTAAGGAIGSLVGGLVPVVGALF